MTALIERLFDPLDSTLAVVAGETARIVVWGLLAGAVSMWLYRLTSPQAKLEELGGRAADARRALNAHQGNFSDALVLMRTSCQLSLERLKVALVPSLLSGLPVVLLLIGLQTRFAKYTWTTAGPDWWQSWLTPFTVAAFASALSLKFALRIK
jgi:hypothetical protein